MIDRELATAKARWGEMFELKCLEGSRGDTLEDDDVLRMLRYFREHDTVYAMCWRASSQTNAATASVCGK